MQPALEEDRHGQRQIIAGVALELPDHLDAAIVPVVEAVGGRPVVGRVGDVGALGLDETRVEVGLRAIENQPILLMRMMSWPSCFRVERTGAEL